MWTPASGRREFFSDRKQVSSPTVCVCQSTHVSGPNPLFAAMTSRKKERFTMTSGAGRQDRTHPQVANESTVMDYVGYRPVS